MGGAFDPSSPIRRRFANYDWTFGYERVVVICREHLGIL
jgi:hypothetical protein